MIFIKTGNKLSEETKQKISNSLKGRIKTVETRNKLSDSLSGENNGMYNKKHTAESKHKMSLSRLGSKNPAARPVKINNIVYDTVKEAVEKLGIRKGIIRERCLSTDIEWLYWEYL